MADWYLNPALTKFRQEVNERWPNRDKTSDGTIGDAAHQSTSSDHNPDSDGSVDAWDMDVDGVDVWKCINAALKHEAIQYVIYDRRITSRSWGLGVWRYYDGPNPHDKHVHFNTRSSHENSTNQWFPEEDFVTTQAEFDNFLINAFKNPTVQAYLKAVGWTYVGGGIPTGMSTLSVLNKTYENAKLAAEKEPTVTVTVDQAQLAAALLDPAFLAAVATAVADENARRQAA